MGLNSRHLRVPRCRPALSDKTRDKLLSRPRALLQIRGRASWHKVFEAVRAATGKRRHVVDMAAMRRAARPCKSIGPRQYRSRPNSYVGLRR